jgi:hypothetical protein
MRSAGPHGAAWWADETSAQLLTLILAKYGFDGAAGTFADALPIARIRAMAADLRAAVV